jgi:mono/diheme cytochrome c family protein
MRSLIVALMFSVLCFGAPVQEPEEAPSGDSDRGRSLFNDRGCYQCHNYDASGSVAGAQLTPDPIPFGAFSRYVREPSGQMPPYTRNVLSEGELADIYAYLLSIPGPPPLDSIPVLNED